MNRRRAIARLYAAARRERDSLESFKRWALDWMRVTRIELIRSGRPREWVGTWVGERQQKIKDAKTIGEVREVLETEGPQIDAMLRWPNPEVPIGA